MSTRIPVLKTWKLFINGQFPRSESGRSIALHDARGRVLCEISHGSRKDLRDAVEAAHAAGGGWAARTAYNRGQILYRLAEMLEGRREELSDALRMGGGRPRTAAERRREIDASIDRLVCFAGWTDKFVPVLGGQNPVAGPYYTFSVPEPTGVVAVLPPAVPALLGGISLLAPILAAGNTAVMVVSPSHPLPALVLAEACATSDVPAGVLNILTSPPEELAPIIASHRGIAAISAADVPGDTAAVLRAGSAENLKRVHVFDLKGDDWYDDARCTSPWMIEPFVEIKTIWHPDR